MFDFDLHLHIICVLAQTRPDIAKSRRRKITPIRNSVTISAVFGRRSGGVCWRIQCIRQYHPHHYNQTLIVTTATVDTPQLLLSYLSEIARRERAAGG